MTNKLKRILLVDDSREFNYLNNYIIKKNGCTDHIQVAENGQQALDILNLGIKETNLFPDLILLDLNMPCINGWEFMEAFKELKFDQKDEIIIVILSSSINPEDKTRAEKIKEVSGFVNKPLTPEKFNILLKEHFNSTPGHTDKFSSNKKGNAHQFMPSLSISDLYRKLNFLQENNVAKKNRKPLFFSY
ncbi:two-component system response regulator [Maribacter sp. ACAM166]|uniref:response regulator n=1 Tax=Maribacter sp. ACAM166 TaxID=2508996 RepID=UPI0010FF164C|nr:response regulator [Maribacter sp. ACAM166]TLP80124.1 response regulator [Maribacter sp. ACAM166]